MKDEGGVARCGLFERGAVEGGEARLMPQGSSFKSEIRDPRSEILLLHSSRGHATSTTAVQPKPALFWKKGKNIFQIWIFFPDLGRAVHCHFPRRPPLVRCRPLRLRADAVWILRHPTSWCVLMARCRCPVCVGRRL